MELCVKADEGGESDSAGSKLDCHLSEAEPGFIEGGAVEGESQHARLAVPLQQRVSGLEERGMELAALTGQDCV